MATIRVRGLRAPQSSRSVSSARRPTACNACRFSDTSAHHLAKCFARERLVGFITPGFEYLVGGIVLLRIAAGISALLL